MSATGNTRVSTASYHFESMIHDRFSTIGSLHYVFGVIDYSRYITSTLVLNFRQTQSIGEIYFLARLRKFSVKLQTRQITYIYRPGIVSSS